MSKKIQDGCELRTIPDFPDYSVSAEGKVYSSKRRGRWLRLGKHLGGYPQAILRRQGKSYNRSVHRLVLEAWVGPCPPGLEGLHFDGDPTNNNVNNLRWGTRSENMQDAVRHGTTTRGERSGNAKLTESIVILIRQLWNLKWMGITQTELANMFGVSRRNIRLIVRRERWAHI